MFDDNLIYLEYKYNSCFVDSEASNSCININVSKERGSIVFNYGDGSFKEYVVNNTFFNKLNKILDKYDVQNWDNYEDVKCIDGDNTFISYKYSDGKYGLISKDKYPIGMEKVFSEVLKYLCNINKLIN